MRGLGFRDHGGLESLELVDVPDPTPGAGEVRVRLEAAAFNRLDRFVLEGIPGVSTELPHILGSDGAGVIDQIGPDVTGWVPGASVVINPGLSDGTCDACARGDEALCRNYRIVGEHTQGTATSFLVLPARNVYPRPTGLSATDAAAFPLVFQTAWRALVTVAQLQPGETVAVIGAGGGVPTAAVQIAKLRGARVVVAARSRAKADRIRALGADEVVVFSEENPLDRLLWQWSDKRGIDVIFDSVGAPTLPKSVRSVARGGRIVVIGGTGGPLAEIDIRPLFWRQASIRGSTMASRAEFEAVLAQVAAGRLKPVVDHVFEWNEAISAFQRLFSSDLFGKVVLRTPPTA